VDEEAREVLRQIRDDNRTAHDEIKESIKCLPCSIHADLISKHGADIAVLKVPKLVNGQQSKLDWKIVAILGGVITALVYLVEKIITNSGG